MNTTTEILRITKEHFFRYSRTDAFDRWETFGHALFYEGEDVLSQLWSDKYFRYAHRDVEHICEALGKMTKFADEKSVPLMEFQEFYPLFDDHGSIIECEKLLQAIELLLPSATNDDGNSTLNALREVRSDIEFFKMLAKMGEEITKITDKYTDTLEKLAKDALDKEEAERLAIKEDKEKRRPVMEAA